MAGEYQTIVKQVGRAGSLDECSGNSKVMAADDLLHGEVPENNADCR